MSRVVYLERERVAVTPAMLLGQGGEAEVYDLGDGRVVKLWKPPAHPDYAGLPDAQAAAARRLAERPALLRALPAGLPPAVVAPLGLATSARRGGGDVVGYAMPRIAGEPLLRFGEPRWRREQGPPAAEVVAALLALHDALAALHARGVVMGDCNDLNVLVAGRAVHLIDVDSYQLPGVRCDVYSERFLDPRLCDPPVLAPVRPHDPDSDWFAFAAMACRTLLWVGPWGGVHQPRDPADRVAPSQRALRGLSVFAPDVVYPRAARPAATLPDALVAHLREVFERGRRGVFPRALLAGLRAARCAGCGDEHFAAACPVCRAAAPRPVVVATGGLRHAALPLAEVARGTWAVGASPALLAPGAPAVWMAGGVLWRQGALGPERIGDVLPGLTRAWASATLGVGFYRAEGYARGFVFDPRRGRLADGLALPPLRGQLVDAHAAIADDRAWLFVTCAVDGRLTTTGVVVDRHGQVLAQGVLDPEAPWLAGLAGACAAGALLFVPTDAGIARVEVVAGALAQTRVFAETAAHVSAADRLALHPHGLDVARPRDAVRLHLA